MKTTIRYVLLLAALLLSSSSFADYYTAKTHTGASVNFYGCDAYTACDNAVNATSSLASGFPSGSQCSYTYTSGSPGSGPLVRSTGQPNTNQIPGGCPTSCPSGEEFDEYNKCVPIGCPDGQIFENGACSPQCVEGAQITLTMQFQDVQQNVTDPFLGCKLQMSAGPLSCNSLMSSCNVTYTDTGLYDENFSWPNGVEPEPVPPIEPALEPITTETVDGPITETVNNPDGSTTTTETMTTTKVNDQGHLVEIIGDSIVLKNQAGEIIEILQQYVTNTYTDGTSQVTETVTTTATPNSITEVKKNLTDGSTTVITRTYNQGLTGSTTTTKTTSYNSQGQPTGSTTVTEGTVSETDGSGEGGGGEPDGELCGAPGQPICDVKIHEEQADYDQAIQRAAELETEFENMMQEHIDSINESEDFGTSDMNWANPQYWIQNFLNLPSSGSCGGIISTSIFGRPFILDPCEKLLPLREILAWFFYIITLFAVSKILLGRKLV